MPTLETPWPQISWVNVTMYEHLRWRKGNTTFQINPVLGQESLARLACIGLADIDLRDIPCDYHKFADIFSKQGAKRLSQHRPFDLLIQIESEKTLPLDPIYSLSSLELQTLRDFIDENLKTGLIRPSWSPCGAPVLFIKKKDGSLQLYINYWGLNKITQKDCYPIPLVTDLWDTPQKAQVYSKIDLRSAYHLIRIADGDEWKTVFWIRYGSYKWLVMPFGLSNASSAFQRLMNEVFADLLDMCVVIYLDNILIYSDNIEDHKRHVREVLHRLWTHELYTSLSKCIFHKEKVKFLGYLIDPEELQMDGEKVRIIKEWPVSCWVKDIQAFLGFMNFYRRFIHNYSELAVPLTRLTKKNSIWDWTTDCQDIFDVLKGAFVTAPVLAH